MICIRLGNEPYFGFADNVSYDAYDWEYVITDPEDFNDFKHTCSVLKITEINAYPKHETLLLHHDFEFVEDRVYGTYVIKQGPNYYRRVLEDFLNELR